MISDGGVVSVGEPGCAGLEGLDGGGLEVGGFGDGTGVGDGVGAEGGVGAGDGTGAEGGADAGGATCCPTTVVV